MFFLEEGVYGSIDAAKRAGAAWPTDQPLTVVELYDPPGGRDMEAHLAFLRSLRDTGVLLMAGPYDGGHELADGAALPSQMVILAMPEDQAREIAEADPWVQSGARYVIRRWRRTF